MTTSKIKKQSNNIFVLKQKVKEAEEILTLKFSPIKSRVFLFKPGQFVLVYFLDNRVPILTRAYSISSCPDEKFLSLTVKKLGAFSSALHNLKIGEKIKISSPQGFFYPEKTMKNVVFLAAGIGVTPFYSIIKDWASQRLFSQNKITLFYSNKKKSEIAFFKDLTVIAKKHFNFKVIFALTRQKSQDKKIKEFTRINLKTIKKHLKTLNGRCYFICGPNKFVADLRNELKSGGVKESLIKSEAFY